MYLKMDRNYEMLEKETLTALKNLYGKCIPNIIVEQVKRELVYIKKNCNAFAFLLAQKIANDSKKMGYITMVRGTPSSSFVSYLLGITEINPLIPHYICYKCKYIKFAKGKFCAYDMEDKVCPICGEKLNKSGYNIPCEMFFGENGERCIDFSINISADIQHKLVNTMQLFCVETFGENIDFVIETENNISTLKINDEKLKNSEYFSIIAYNDITKLRELQSLTGIDIMSISFDDKKTWALFNTCDLKGISEFDTNFVMNILKSLKPKCIDDLIRCSGLSHGTNTWTNNAEFFVGNHRLNELVSCRDDVFLYFINKGIDRKIAFGLFKKIYMGKTLNEEEITILLKSGISQWYIESCKCLSYLFPRAHCAEYSLMAYRLAFFKANYPNEFDIVLKKLQ